MRRRTFAALGVGTTLSLATGLLLVSPPLSSPAVAAGELRQFEGCEELRQWYVDSALPLVGPWGWGGAVGYAADQGLVTATRAAVPEAATATGLDAGSTDRAVGNGDTGTNVQEAGVDEPDFVKTDGTTVVEIRGRSLVLTDVAGEPRELSRLDLPRWARAAELFLVGDRVLVLGQDMRFAGPVLRDLRMLPPVGGAGSTYLLSVDIGDRSAPRIVSEQEYDGQLVSAREYDGTIRLVLTGTAPSLDFVLPGRDRTRRQARRENRRIVRDSTIDDWLPMVRTGAQPEPLLDCTDVRHPEHHSGFGTISIVTFGADSPTDPSATAVTAAGDLVYSSTDRLYVATTSDPWWGRPVPLDAAEQRRRRQLTTQVHSFALTDATTVYAASGDVPGTVRDRWSLSEYDGHLRVATALGRDPWAPDENAVVVLEERDARLVEVGRAGAMGIDEQIQSVRWFGEVAVVVTFRQVDPLYTVDLSDPTRPRVLGELKIPGFSAYLHPIGGDRLLGLGQDATLRGRTKGAQAAVFDISDLTQPERLGTVGFGRHTELMASWDPRAFTYLPEQSVALSAVQDYGTGRVSLVTFRVDDDGSITARTERLGRWQIGTVRTLPLPDGEVALVTGGAIRKLRP